VAMMVTEAVKVAVAAVFLAQMKDFVDFLMTVLVLTSFSTLMMDVTFVETQD
jgi:hypothetical protein